MVLQGLVRVAAGHPFFAVFEQEILRIVGADVDLPSDPGVIVLVHVGVILDVAAQRAVEVPEPVRTQLVPTGAQKDS